MNRKTSGIMMPEMARFIFDNKHLSSTKLNEKLTNISYYSINKLKTRINKGLTYDLWLEVFKKRHFVMVSENMTAEQISNLNVSCTTKSKLRKKFGFNTKKYSQELKDFIANNYNTITESEAVNALNVSRSVVISIARNLCVKFIKKRVIGRIESFVIANHKDMTKVELAKESGASYGYIVKVLRKNGICAKRVIPESAKSSSKNIRVSYKQKPSKRLKANLKLNPHSLKVKPLSGLKRVDIGYMNIKIEVPFGSTPEFIASKVEKARNLFMSR